MTTEEAIKRLEKIKAIYSGMDIKSDIEALDMAIKAFQENEKLIEEFEREIEIANKDIDLMPEQEEYMRGYLGGILCAYRIVFGKSYEESEEEE